MIVSDKILPIRFYDDLYDQSRFSRLCHDTCQFNLVYPASKLPHFQFRRDGIFALPEHMFLRNVCNDIDNNYYKEIPEGADNFCNPELVKEFYNFGNGATPVTDLFPWEVPLETTVPLANYLVDLFTVDCCKFKMITANIPNNATIEYINLSYPLIEIPISSGTDRYKFKIIVDKLEGTSTIKVYNGLATLLGVISAAGVYEYEFTSVTTSIYISPETISYGDYFEISYMQATRLRFDTLLTNDVALSPSDIEVVTMSDGTDILVYCSPTSYTSNIADGEYYYVVKSGSSFYFSEVFKVVSLREIEKLYKLKWNHDCDFNSSVLYASQTINCTFENILYLDANLIKPEYDTAEEVEVNGQGDPIPRFKRWQKNTTLEIGKSPAFLTDALSAVFLHKNISILEPLNWKQDVQNNLHEVLKVTNDISDILYECYQSVKLKLLLEDKITDTACCNLAEIVDCEPCDYTAGTSAEDCASGYYLTIVDGNGVWWTSGCTVMPRYSYTLRDCAGNAITVKETDIICYEGQYIRLGWHSGENCFGTDSGSFWYPISIAPVITTAVFAFIGFYITGELIPNTYGKAYFQINCTGPWILADTFSVGDDGTYTFLYPLDLFTEYFGEVECVCFKVENVTLNCEFGTTNTAMVNTCL